jgi:hypothetical protein
MRSRPVRGGSSSSALSRRRRDVRTGSAQSRRALSAAHSWQSGLPPVPSRRKPIPITPDRQAALLWCTSCWIECQARVCGLPGGVGSEYVIEASIRREEQSRSATSKGPTLGSVGTTRARLPRSSPSLGHSCSTGLIDGHGRLYSPPGGRLSVEARAPPTDVRRAVPPDGPSRVRVST